MIRTGLTVFAVTFFLGGATISGGDSKPDADVKKLQGTWKFLAHAHGDKATSKEDLAKMKITFKGDKFSVILDDKVVQAGTQKLDSSKKPARVDSTVTDGEGKGSTMLGIYELKGNTLRVCFDPSGKERPTSLTAKDGQFSATIQKEKK